MIRRRLVIAITLTVAVAIGIGSWYIVRTLEARLIADVDKQFITGSLDLGSADVPMPSSTEANPIFDERRQVAVIRYGPGGRVMRAVPSGSTADPDPLPDTADLEPEDGLTTIEVSDGPRYRAAAFVDRAGGRTVVAASLAEVDAAVDDARNIQLLVGALAIAIVAGTVWLLTRRAFAPIDGMIATAGRIADGDLTERTRVAEPRTEVGQLGTALNTMLDRIEGAVATATDSEARMRRFVDDASHDLRTPLTSVRGYAELYRQGATDPDSVAEQMSRIEAEASRMSRLVDDLMALARLDQNRGVDRRPVDVGTVLGTAVDSARVIDDARTYDLDAPTGITVPGDVDQLRQVLDNLLSNVREHTPAGTTVTVGLTATDDAAVITVVDDGPGLPPTDRARAFDRFWRATRADQGPRAGSGLGLSIVRSIVQAHGGTVDLDVGPAGGAYFRIRLPRSLSAPSDSTPSGSLS